MHVWSRCMFAQMYIIVMYHYIDGDRTVRICKDRVGPSLSTNRSCKNDLDSAVAVRMFTTKFGRGLCECLSYSVKGTIKQELSSGYGFLKLSTFSECLFDSAMATSHFFVPLVQKLLICKSSEAGRCGGSENTHCAPLLETLGNATSNQEKKTWD